MLERPSWWSQRSSDVTCCEGRRTCPQERGGFSNADGNGAQVVQDKPPHPYISMPVIQTSRAMASYHWWFSGHPHLSLQFMEDDVPQLESHLFGQQDQNRSWFTSTGLSRQLSRYVGRIECCRSHPMVE